jgi:AbrB family looped-hinge helix DNA binding protein
MKIEHCQMDKFGRILIPSNIRQSLNYKQGDSFVIRAINDELHIVSINKEVKSVQKLFKKYNPNSNSSVDEFLDSRKIDVDKENKKFTLDE